MRPLGEWGQARAVSDPQFPAEHQLSPGDSSAEVDRRTLLQAWALLLLAFSWLALTVPAGGFDADLAYWVKWSHRIERFGLARVYGGLEASANYLPVFMWILAGLGRLTGGPLSQETVPLVKVAALAFELGLGLALAQFLWRRSRNPALALLVMLNPATLYDSWVWGQIDAMHTALVALAWMALASGSVAAACVLFLLALNTKLQSVVFLPFFALAAVAVLGRSWRGWLRTAAACVATQLALLWPFLDGRALRGIWGNVTGIVGYFPAVSLNAYNLWYFLVEEPADTPDTVRWLGVSYRAWGVVLLAAALAVLTVPLARWVRGLVLRKELRRLGQEGFFFLGMAGLSFFAFATEAHERFLHPAVTLLGIDAVLRGRYALFAISSAAYLLNLEDVLRWRGVGYESGLFEPKLIASAVLVAWAAGAWRAWRPSRPASSP